MDVYTMLMRTIIARAITGAVLICATPAYAQLLPPLPPAGRTLDRLTGIVPLTDRALGDARALAQAQVERARDLARRYPERVAIDAHGNAVRAGELIVIDADASVVDAAARRGFRLIERVELAEMGVRYARFETPRGVTIALATRQLRAIARGLEVTADALHFASGNGAAPATAPVGVQAAQGRGAARIGIIDGGVPAGWPGLARQQSFADGGPRPHDHATAIASILNGGGGVRASAPGARLYVADVYGGDPAGGNAAAIGQALAWMVREKVPVVVVSLVGPSNPLLARIVAAARRMGTVVVAAVGNDGPAARPAYPASYPQALAVTGVDARGRVLIEAGRAAKLDYAAPGADLIALGVDGRARVMRGTSYAAPFVAARLSAHYDGTAEDAITGLDNEARRSGGGSGYGRGLICGDCATRPR